MKYDISKKVNLPFEKATEKVIEELKKEGFGVITTIDMKETLKNKINVEFKKYVILGACNPHLAHKAIQSEEKIGLFLPCNVIVYEEGDKSVVAVFDPNVINYLVYNETIKSFAEEARRKLLRAIEAV